MYKPLEYEYHMTPDSKMMGRMKWTLLLVVLVVIVSPFTPLLYEYENQLLFAFFIVMSFVCDFLSLTLTYSLNQYVIEDIEKEIKNGQAS
jgi:hypothetical protein